MEQTHGTWGRRVVTRRDCYTEVAILYLKPNKRCSWHYHKHKYNQFYVIQGELTIKTDIGPDNQENFTTIKAGQFFTVPPEVTHEFSTGGKFLQDTIIEEIAYVKIDDADIYRKRLGGDVE